MKKIVALTNIYDGKKRFAVGEIVENLSESEEVRLLKLKCVKKVEYFDVETNDDDLKQNVDAENNKNDTKQASKAKV